MYRKDGSKCTDTDVMEYCRTRLASFKRPRKVLFVNELPRNPMGKIIKKELRDKYGNREK